MREESIKPIANITYAKTIVKEDISRNISQQDEYRNIPKICPIQSRAVHNNTHYSLAEASPAISEKSFLEYTPSYLLPKPLPNRKQFCPFCPPGTMALHTI